MTAKRLLIAALLIAMPASAFAIDLDKMQIANGLAAIVSNSDVCGFKINEDALADYYVKSGLANPEALAFVNDVISLKSISEKPSSAQCTLVRTTAKTSGLLVE
jgi:hypothetical protein